MAYMNQECKAKLAPAIKAVLAKYKLKGSLSVNNHSTLVVTIKSGAIDFIKNGNDRAALRDRAGMPTRRATDYMQVNEFWFHEHFDGIALDCLTELYAAMKGTDWYDRSDSQIDYFDIAYYLNVNIGQWDKPYQLV